MNVSKIIFYTLSLFISASVCISGNTWQTLKKEAQQYREHIKAAKIKSVDRTEHTYKFGAPEKRGIKKEAIKYDTSGQRIEWATYYSDGTLSAKYKYRYDSKGNKSEETKYNPDNTIASKILFTYDDSNNETEAVWYFPDGGIEAKSVSHYDSAGRIYDFTKFRYDGLIIQRKTYSYNGNGSLIEENNFKTEQLDVPKTNIRKRKTEETTSDKRTFAYDANENMIEEILYKTDGSINVKFTYKYDSTGHLSEMVEIQGEKSSKGIRKITIAGVSQKTLYFYNTNGDLILAQVYNMDGSIGAKTEYTYDTNRSKTEEVYYTVRLDEPETVNKYIYKYYQPQP
ncbi:MAG: hypothetical protein AAB071_04410 [Bacteroidota bacterium]